MIDWTHDKISELIDLLRGAAVLGAVAVVIWAYLKHRTLIAVLVAAITAGIFLFIVHNPEWWQQRVSEETSTPAPAAVVVPVTGPDEPAGGFPGLGRSLP